MKTRLSLLLLVSCAVAGALLLSAPALAQSLGETDAEPAVDATVTPLAERAAAAHRAAARYPADSQPLDAAALDPIVEERIVHPAVARGDDGDAATLVAWVESTVVTVGEPIRIGARLDLPAETSGLSARATAKASIGAEIVDADGTVVAATKLFDDGVAPDAIAGDGIASAEIALPRGLAPELATSYLVRVDALTPTGLERSAALGVVYSNPAGTLTGRFRDAVVDGDLVVEAEVDVRRAARFHVAGTVEDADGLLGKAQAATELEPGVRWIALRFYGLLFHERQVAGPLTIGSVTLSTTGGIPNALGPVLFDAHQVTERPVDVFRAVPFGDPARLESARRLEASLEGR